MAKKKLDKGIVKDVHGGKGDAWIKQLDDGSFIVINEKGEDLANFRFEGFYDAVKWTILQELNLHDQLKDDKVIR